MSKRAWIIVGAVVAFIVLIGGVVAATSGGDDDKDVATTDATTTTTTLVPTGGNTGGGTSGGGTPSGQSSGGGATGPQPTVVSFTTLSGNADVDCHNGNSVQQPDPGDEEDLEGLSGQVRTGPCVAEMLDPRTGVR